MMDESGLIGTKRLWILRARAGRMQVGCRGRFSKQCSASLLSMYERRSQYLNGTAQQCIDMLGQ